MNENVRIRKIEWLLLLLLLAFLFVAADGIRIIQYPPRSVHIFRQGDCLAYTRTYYQQGQGLFSPSAYNLLGRDGKVASEFPFMYYLSAKLCHVVGFHYWVIRGCTFLVYLLGLFYLYACIRYWVKDIMLSLLVVVLTGASPYYFYYGTNFLPNVPAISISFIGLYYMLRYRLSFRVPHLLIGISCFALAAVIKPTDGGLIWLAYTAALFGAGERNRYNQRRWLHIGLGTLAVILAIVGWFFFVRYYNKVNGNDINLQGTCPMWGMRWYDISSTFTLRIMGYWRDALHHPVLLLLLCVFFALYLVWWKEIDRFLRRFVMFLILGSLAYTPLWYRAFGDHDYYILIYTIPAAFTAIAVLSVAAQRISTLRNRSARAAVYLVVLGLMLVAIYHNQAVQLLRYRDENAGICNTSVFYVEPYLRQLGITEQDIVLSVPDNTPNVSLAGFGNKGYTSDLFGAATWKVPYCRDHGAKYMIIYDGSYINKPEYKPWTGKKIGEYKGIFIYDIR